MNTVEMNPIKTATFEQLMNEVPQQRIEHAVSYWADRSLDDVKSEMPATQRYGHADIAVVNPDGDTDETRTLLLPLEYNQGATVAHYMRAKVLQQYAAPNSRVIILPNSGLGMPHVDTKNGLTDSQREAMGRGDYMPYAQLLTNTLEQANRVHSFGALDIEGSSQGALTGLGIGANGSESLEVSRIVAIETPSKAGRNLGKLAVDFIQSGGGMSGLPNSVKGSEIKAQAQAMNFMRSNWDVAKFFARSVGTTEARLIAKSMTGDANEMAVKAISQLGSGVINLIHIENSKVFDPTSLAPEVYKNTKQLYVVGDDAYAHSTPNNLRFNAAMAYSGLKQAA